MGDAPNTTLRGFDLWSVPYDGASTLGWPGSRQAPAAILANLAWMQMRTESERIFAVETGGLIDFEADQLRNRGDVGVVPHDLMATLDATSMAVQASVRDGRVPIVLGGDDSLLFGAVRGFHDACEGSVGVIHFDAHLDLSDGNSRQGTHSQSSGMRRALELPRVDAQRSIQVGVRHFNFPSSRDFIERCGIAEYPARRVWLDGVDAAVGAIKDRVAGAGAVFLSFDIDAIDPAFAPGAGAFEPGGLTSREALEFVRALAPLCSGLAVTEVNPMIDPSGRTANLAAYLVFYFVAFGAAALVGA